MLERLVVPIRSDKLQLNIKVRERVCSVQSEFQLIEIFETDVFGKVLLLDGHIQLTELDESAYHEMLIQVPLLSIDSPKKALVVGGGDGGVIREICKHDSIERIDMVEIDSQVVEICNRHLPNVSDGAFDDHRVNIVIADAFEFVKNALDEYDLIVVDCTDVYEEEDGALSELLFTREFYEDCRRVLSDKGIIVSQADNLLFCPYSLKAIEKAFGEVFPIVGSYWAVIPSFGGFSGYCWASKGAQIALDFPQNRTRNIRLKYLSDSTYRLAFSNLPFRVEIDG